MIDKQATPEAAQALAAAPKKVFIRTFGCQMNVYDSDKMVDVLRAAQGYEPTTDVEQAPCRSKAGGFVGNGCVGDVRSPGTVDWTTGRSSIKALCRLS